ncbi:hypothetical protein SAMN05444007_106135 [Cribrihabitans marinus]|uniref:Histidinol phosphate aminotransferase n=1 Tax=Cribrihabitans marinus TaxID=1227549 RepID=A0A1H7AVB6_9RHOB|nr:hypothetical protein [Cribrihabitans marinus]GGH32332.1 hypothetical protein GCM10010973_23720 [Cribrihabitans marinus]SEJ67827.1 hypothetical protein SAMN05444007_106135 [Cribrihabitans marinus]
MNDHRMKSAPNYTNAALTMLGVNLIWIFAVLWTTLGFLAPLALAALLNHAISRLAGRRSAG